MAINNLKKPRQRLKTNTGQSKPTLQAKPTIQAAQNIIYLYSTLLSRAKLAARLGQQYDNDRDLYEALGYDLNPTYSNFAAHYERQDIAAAVINRPIDASWRGGFKLVEILKDRKDRKELTSFENEWTALEDRLKITPTLKRIDRLVGLGQYGVLLLGLDDVKQSKDFESPVMGKRNLLYLKPLGQENAKIAEYDENTSSSRYSLPTIYNIQISNPGTTTSSSLRVHYSRVIHILPEIMLESETEGVPRLKDIYNRLMDLEKLVGGSAEMFWRGARPGYQGKLDETHQLGSTTIDDLQDQVDEFEHNLRRLFINEGISLEALQQQIADPSKHIDVQIQMICATTGIPKRILVGSERGELASSQDRDTWLESCETRRTEYINPSIIYPFVDRCMEFGVLSTPPLGYFAEWEDLFAKGEKDMAEIGEIRSRALANYARSPISEEIITPNDFYKIILALTDDQIDQINKSKAEMIDDEDKDFENEEEDETQSNL